MPPTDRLLRDLWRAIEHAGDVERELRVTAEVLASWQQIARAALAALDEQITRRRDEAARTTVGQPEQENRC
jgi:hypothetical protein